MAHLLQSVGIPCRIRVAVAYLPKTSTANAGSDWNIPASLGQSYINWREANTYFSLMSVVRVGKSKTFSQNLHMTGR